MNQKPFDVTRLETLLFLAAGNLLTEAESSEISRILRDHPTARSFAARSLILDSLLIESLAMQEVRTRYERPSSPVVTKPQYMARAAAWIGAFFLIEQQAQAATTSAAVTQTTITLLMKKTITSITFAILIFGGLGIYFIHHHNESAKQRVIGMEFEIQSLSDQLGIKTRGNTGRQAGSQRAENSVNIVPLLAMMEDNKISREESALFEKFRLQLKTMDVESLKNLLLDAEKISNPVNHNLANHVLKKLIELDPAEAARLSTMLSGRSNAFNFTIATCAAQAFESWLEQDPVAADAWYRETLAVGGLNGKNIPPNGLEEHSLVRSFERLRFKAMLQSNPAVAESMLATMFPGDVTKALSMVTDPDAIRNILPKLKPEQRVDAAQGVIGNMAANDPNAAHAWAKSLEMPDRERDTLMAGSIKDAVASGKLDLAAVSDWMKKLDLDPKTRSQTQINSVISASRLPGGDEGATDWNRVNERIDWLRQEASPESADRMVGEYLGRLALTSQTPDQSFKAYEAEIARRGNAAPALTIAYARLMGMINSSRFSDQAMKYLKALPPSQERENAMQMIESNR